MSEAAARYIIHTYTFSFLISECEDRRTNFKETCGHVTESCRLISTFVPDSASDILAFS